MKLRFRAANAMSPAFAAGCVHHFPQFTNAFALLIYFQKELAFWGRVCYIIFCKE